MKTFRNLLSLLILLATLGYAIFMGLVVMFFGGIVKIVEAIKETPTNYREVFIGVIMVLLAKLSFILVSSIGSIIAEWVHGEDE